MSANRGGRTDESLTVIPNCVAPVGAAVVVPHPTTRYARNKTRVLYGRNPCSHMLSLQTGSEVTSKPKEPAEPP